MTLKRVASILAIVFILFLALFAFDVFMPGISFFQALGAFLVHLVPNYFVLVALLIAWKYEKIGGFAFLLLGVAFTILFQTYHFWQNFLLVSAPLFLIGTLFLFDYYKKGVTYGR